MQIPIVLSHNNHLDWYEEDGGIVSLGQQIVTHTGNDDRIEEDYIVTLFADDAPNHYHLSIKRISRMVPAKPISVEGFHSFVSDDVQTTVNNLLSLMFFCMG